MLKIYYDHRGVSDVIVLLSLRAKSALRNSKRYGIIQNNLQQINQLSDDDNQRNLVERKFKASRETAICSLAQTLGRFS